MSDLFQDKVVPIMDRIKSEYDEKRREELRHARRSLSQYANVTGGVFADTDTMHDLKFKGEWSSKTVEDYVADVKAEIKKAGIAVTPDLEKKMIDKMVTDSVPQSSIEYILSTASNNSIFLDTDLTPDSPLKKEIEEKAEKQYDPNFIEKTAGWALGSATDMGVTFGLGGGFSAAKAFVATDVVINAAIDAGEHAIEKAEEKEKKGKKEEQKNQEQTVVMQDIPSIVMPEHRAEWLADQNGQQGQSSNQAVAASKADDQDKAREAFTPWQTSSVESTAQKQAAAEEKTRLAAEEAAAQQQLEEEERRRAAEEEQKEKEEESPLTITNMTGWQGLWDSLGVGGLSNIAHNPGTTAAMLPDVLMGIFTGKTSMKGTLIPAAGLLSGMFMDKKNPLRKLVILASLLALINKPIQSSLAANNIRTAAPHLDKPADRIANEPQYVRYQDEPLNERVSNPHIEGNRFEAYIDGVHRSLTLPDRAADAYNRGAVPLNKLANTMLSVIDQNDLLASENYEHVDNADREAIHKTISQR